jgi:hypothetical protein
MSEKGKLVFEDVVKNLRTDLKFLAGLFLRLKEMRAGTRFADAETRIFVTDVCLDKTFEIESRISKLIQELGIATYVGGEMTNLSAAIGSMEEFVFDVAYMDTSEFDFSSFDKVPHYFAVYVEKVIASARRTLHTVKEWAEIAELSPTDYVTADWKRYVSARDELELAREAIDNAQWDDVMNHVRSAMEGALKEKFGFQRIQPMVRFIEDADRHGFPLPSFDLLYSYFDVGSSRIHAGRIHTPFEAQHVYRFAASFLDQLELIQVENSVIRDFASKCSAVIL